jgi:hypothetical protein
MSGEEIDNLLSSIIIVLLIVVVWKWYQGHGKCSQDSVTLSCGCKNGQCKCRGVARISRRSGCSGGRGCSCGCPPGRCNCGPQCSCQRLQQPDTRESMSGGCQKQCENKQIGTPGYEPKEIYHEDNYSGDTVQQMALEPEVIQSQKDYLDGLGFSGLPTGSSHETTLEETGRSYGSSSFVGLSQRKFCKARQMIEIDPSARVVPTEHIKEWCNIDENELV